MKSTDEDHAKNVLCSQTIYEYSKKLRELGCAVIALSPEELRGADVEQVQDAMLQKAWDVIDQLVGPEERDADDPTPGPG